MKENEVVENRLAPCLTPALSHLLNKMPIFSHLSHCLGSWCPLPYFHPAHYGCPELSELSSKADLLQVTHVHVRGKE